MISNNEMKKIEKKYVTTNKPSYCPVCGSTLIVTRKFHSHEEKNGEPTSCKVTVTAKCINKE